MALTTRFSLALLATLTNVRDLATGSDPLNYLKTVELATGTAANQADMLWHDQRTITASSNEDLDLAGALTNTFGATQTFAELKGLIIYAATGNTNNVRVTRPASNGVPLFLAASDGIDVRPGGLLAWLNPGDGGVAVTAGTGDLINVANSSSGSSVTYDVILIGVSA